MGKWSQYPVSFVHRNYFLISADIWQRYENRELGIGNRDKELKEIQEIVESMKIQPPPIDVKAEVASSERKRSMHDLYMETAEAIELPTEESMYGGRRGRRRRRSR
jgi:hypothetical protein